MGMWQAKLGRSWTRWSPGPGPCAQRQQASLCAALQAGHLAMPQFATSGWSAAGTAAAAAGCAAPLAQAGCLAWRPAQKPNGGGAWGAESGAGAPVGEVCLCVTRKGSMARRLEHLDAHECQNIEPVVHIASNNTRHSKDP